MTNHFGSYGNNVVNTNVLHIEGVETVTKQTSCLRCLTCQNWLSGMKESPNLLQGQRCTTWRYSDLIWIQNEIDVVMVWWHLLCVLIVGNPNVGFCSPNIYNSNRWMDIKTKLRHIGSDVNDIVLVKVITHVLLTNIFEPCLNVGNNEVTLGDVICYFDQEMVCFVVNKWGYHLSSGIKYESGSSCITTLRLDHCKCERIKWQMIHRRWLWIGMYMVYYTPIDWIFISDNKVVVLR